MNIPSIPFQRVLYDRSPLLACLPIKVMLSLSVSMFPKRLGEMDTTYEEEAWNHKCLSVRFIDDFASDLDGVKTDMIGDDLTFYSSSKVEAELEKGGFYGTAVPHFYNPVHSCFASYRSHTIDGQFILAQQFSNFYRYAVVPDVPLQKCGINIKASYAW